MCGRKILHGSPRCLFVVVTSSLARFLCADLLGVAIDNASSLLLEEHDVESVDCMDEKLD
jgi:hypothetical protein